MGGGRRGAKETKEIKGKEDKKEESKAERDGPPSEPAEILTERIEAWVKTDNLSVGVFEGRMVVCIALLFLFFIHLPYRETASNIIVAFICIFITAVYWKSFVRPGLLHLLGGPDTLILRVPNLDHARNKLGLDGKHTFNEQALCLQKAPLSLINKTQCRLIADQWNSRFQSAGITLGTITGFDTSVAQELFHRIWYGPLNADTLESFSNRLIYSSSITLICRTGSPVKSLSLSLCCDKWKAVASQQHTELILGGGLDFANGVRLLCQLETLRTQWGCMLVETGKHSPSNPFLVTQLDPFLTRCQGLDPPRSALKNVRIILLPTGGIGKTWLESSVMWRSIGCDATKEEIVAFFNPKKFMLIEDPKDRVQDNE